jgi:peptidoglycan/xylan/chitin deacetylase (PgdA/CDA1 family)
MVKKIWMHYAHNRYVARLLRFFPDIVFQDLHRWPTQFLWTDKKVTFCLSFDCDNPTDADVLPALLSQLRRYGISASFAVCGAMVEETVKQYEQVITEGHEIINHGYSKHLEALSDSSVRSTLFYDKLSADRIEEEIAKNHECLQRVLGVTPLGFRVPHFGTFQRPADIELTYKLLRKYRYYKTSLNSK